MIPISAYRFQKKVLALRPISIDLFDNFINLDQQISQGLETTALLEVKK
jgi:hypothetical protein